MSKRIGAYRRGQQLTRSETIRGLPDGYMLRATRSDGQTIQLNSVEEVYRLGESIGQENATNFWKDVLAYHQDYWRHGCGLETLITQLISVGIALYGRISAEIAYNMIVADGAIDEHIMAHITGSIKCVRYLRHRGLGFDLENEFGIWRYAKDAAFAYQAYITENNEKPLIKFALRSVTEKPVFGGLLNVERGGIDQEPEIILIVDRARKHRENDMSWRQIAKRVGAEIAALPDDNLERFRWDSWVRQGTEVENLQTNYRREEKRRQKYLSP